MMGRAVGNEPQRHFCEWHLHNRSLRLPQNPSQRIKHPATSLTHTPLVRTASHAPMSAADGLVLKLSRVGEIGTGVL